MARKKTTTETPAPAPAPAKPEGEQTEKKPAAKGGLLGGLMGKVKETKKTPAAAKKDKPVIRCESPDEEAILDRFTAADAIYKVAAAGQTQAKAGAHEVFRKRFLRLCVQRGSMPENPQITSTNSRCNLIVKHMKKLKLGEKDPSVREQLEGLGVPDADIDRICGDDENEGKVVKQKPSLGLKKFTDLTADTATGPEKAVAEKLMALVQENFDDEELALLLEKQVDVMVDESWQDTAVQIAVKMAGGNEDQAINTLEALFAVIAPQFVMSQMVFSGQLTDAFDRMRVAPPDAGTEKVLKSGNGKYKAVIKGVEVSLFLLRPGSEDEALGTKKCTNPGHAEATAKKLFSDSEYLADFLANQKK